MAVKCDYCGRKSPVRQMVKTGYWVKVRFYHQACIAFAK